MKELNQSPVSPPKKKLDHNKKRVFKHNSVLKTCFSFKILITQNMQDTFSEHSTNIQ